jgi:predicted helicase
MFALKSILDNYRSKALSEREKGTYFERLIRCYFKNEPCYEDLFSDVWMYSDWARKSGLPAQDTGIDLVARTRTDELVAIQCKLHAEDHTLQKKDIDSFFTASGKSRFARRIIVSSTNQWSRPAEDALADQVPPVTKIDLEDLEHSRIDWSRYEPLEETVPLRPRKTLREHQIAAVRDVLAGLANADRGKLIMACGTGKTFTSLKIAEQIAGRGGRVLFLVPSLSLLSQILTEWAQETELPMHAFAVCSDSDVGKKRSTPANDDDVQTLIHELKYPATTDAASLARAMARVHDPGHLSVVFSTYHSIEVLGEAQARHGLPAFDLIVCDEAHRTTGAIFENEDESAFVRVHDAGFIHARKRLYMTATPRIYGDAAKVRAESESVTLCSMDDPALYGPTLHTISFSRAVQLQLLVDYKVIVLAVEESHVSRRLQALLSDDDNQLKVTDAAKIVGCWKALGKRDLTQDLIGDAEPMRRAVAFCQVIRATGKAKYHQVASETIAAQFQAVVDAYQEQEEDLSPEARLTCQAAHVDGSMNAGTKEAKLRWLKDDAGDGVCRILSNVRCLSEGVDVPALDAVLFLTPRNSQVDVVQSVGRVMRLSPGKKRGYVILPVVIPAGMEPQNARKRSRRFHIHSMKCGAFSSNGSHSSFSRMRVSVALRQF